MKKKQRNVKKNEGSNKSHAFGSFSLVPPNSSAPSIGLVFMTISVQPKYIQA